MSEASPNFEPFDEHLVRTCAIVEVIRVTFLAGRGVAQSPIYEVTQYWTKQGVLISCNGNRDRQCHCDLHAETKRVEDGDG